MEEELKIYTNSKPLSAACEEIIKYVNSQPEAFSSVPRTDPNPWHASGTFFILLWFNLFSKIRSYFCPSFFVVAFFRGFIFVIRFIGGGGGNCIIS